DVSPYLNPSSGEASLNLFKMTRSAFATELRSAIAAARKGKEAAAKHSLRTEIRGEPREITVQVMRIDPPAAKERAYVIVFEETPVMPAQLTEGKRNKSDEKRSQKLEEGMASLKANLQSLSEEHEATNEE